MKKLLVSKNRYEAFLSDENGMFDMTEPLNIGEYTLLIKHKGFIKSGENERFYVYSHGPIFRAVCIYETYSNTIRSIPENYCLVCWENDDINKPVFNMDGAVSDEIRNICKQQHQYFLSPCNQKGTDAENKTRLCLFISERLKEAGKAPYLVPNLCNDTQLHKSFIKA